MIFAELVRKARTHRRFDESQPITRDELRQFVDIVRLTSNGGNQQPLRYRIVTGKDECAKVFPHTAWAGSIPEWSGPAEGERPTGYIAILSKRAAKTDSGIAAATLQYAAAANGYATCILGAIKRPVIKEVLSIGDPYEILLLVAFGKPGETVVIDDIHEGDEISYYRTPDGTHHVPKLALDDVLID